MRPRPGMLEEVFSTHLPGRHRIRSASLADADAAAADWPYVLRRTAIREKALDWITHEIANGNYLDDVVPQGQVIVVDYDPSWPDTFEHLRAHIWPRIQDLATAIEHVGSTSVRGLAAKPVVDMTVVVPAAAAMRTVIDRLAMIGYWAATPARCTQLERLGYEFAM